jgi:hypothetical protein
MYRRSVDVTAAQLDALEDYLDPDRRGDRAEAEAIENFLSDSLAKSR